MSFFPFLTYSKTVVLDFNIKRAKIVILYALINAVVVLKCSQTLPHTKEKEAKIPRPILKVQVLFPKKQRGSPAYREKISNHEW